MPRDTSQSQMSEPSPLMANAWYPPPGNTIMATPVAPELAAYTVIVGVLTLNAPPPESPDSGLGFGIVSGGTPGQIGTCTWPGAGCHAAPASCACAVEKPDKIATRNGMRSFMGHAPCGRIAATRGCNCAWDRSLAPMRDHSLAPL